MNTEVSTQVKSTQTGRAERSRTYDMAYIGIFAVVIAICSWISIPAAVPFTLQTFAVFLSVVVLGGRRGTLSVVVYILIGAIGVPVFSGFNGGLGALMNTTGGYIIGFFFTALIMWAVEGLAGRKLWAQAVSMVLGLAVCYVVGTVWFVFVYSRTIGAVGMMTVLGWCVIPFIIPDLVKIALALMLGNTLRKPLAGVIGYY